jgi:hypothetical protein
LRREGEEQIGRVRWRVRRRWLIQGGRVKPHRGRGRPRSGQEVSSSLRPSCEVRRRARSIRSPDGWRRARFGEQHARRSGGELDRLRSEEKIRS